MKGNSQVLILHHTHLFRHTDNRGILTWWMLDIVNLSSGQSNLHQTKNNPYNRKNGHNQECIPKTAESVFDRITVACNHLAFPGND